MEIEKKYGTTINVSDEYLTVDGSFTLTNLLGIQVKEITARPKDSLDANDCMVRSVAILLNYPDFKQATSQYKEVYRSLAMIGERRMSLMNHVTVAEEYLQPKGYRLINFQYCMGLGQFLATHKVGKFIVCTDCHAFPYIDGVIYDTFGGILTIEHEFGHDISYVYCENEMFHML